MTVGRYIIQQIKEATDSIPAGILSLVIFSPILICLLTSHANKALLWIAFMLLSTIVGYFANLTMKLLVRYLERSTPLGHVTRLLRPSTSPGYFTDMLFVFATPWDIRDVLHQRMYLRIGLLSDDQAFIYSEVSITPQT